MLVGLDMIFVIFCLLGINLGIMYLMSYRIIGGIQEVLWNDLNFGSFL